ncbi:MAG: FxLYD domain-containing protein, partial [Candidatus Nitrosocosmicus sp.]|nr:FxLYD domain-containing protein [Candidatus Nitrosocosmicus sp.]
NSCYLTLILAETLSIRAIQFLLTITTVHLVDAQLQELNAVPRDKVDLSISELSVGWTDSGNVYVSGLVVNNSTNSVEDVIVNVLLFNRDNELIKQDNRFVTPPSSILERGEEQEFRFFLIADNTYRYDVSSFGSTVQ